MCGCATNLKQENLTRGERSDLPISTHLRNRRVEVESSRQRDDEDEGHPLDPQQGVYYEHSKGAIGQKMGSANRSE